MLFDFCVCDRPTAVEGIFLDTIFYINGDDGYATPHKPALPGKTYFVYTLRGEGTIRFNGKTTQVFPDTFLFFQPDQTFSYWCSGSQWEFWWFEFTGPCPWVSNALYLFKGGPFASALLTNSLQYAKAGQWGLASSLFLSLAKLLIYGASQSRRPGTKESIVSAAEEYIRAHISQVTVEDLAVELGVEQRTLRNIFNSVLSMSPKQLITQIRLELAGYLLTGTALSLEEIASRLGFSSQYHLSKAFKDHFSITPARYRKYIRAVFHTTLL